MNSSLPSYQSKPLTSRWQWYSWIAYIQRCARAYHVAEFTNLDIPPASIPALTEPAFPVSNDGQTSTQAFNNYNLHMSRYMRLNNSMTALDSLIMRSVSEDIRLHLQRLTSVNGKLQYLKNFYQPTDTEWKQVLMNRIAELSHPDATADLIAWSARWITLAAEVLEADLPNINEIYMRNTFLEAAGRLDHAYKVQHVNVPEEDPTGKTHNLYSVIRTWQLIIRDKDEQPPERHTPAMFSVSQDTQQTKGSSATLNSKPTTSQATINACACGNLRRYTDCWYIVE